MTFWILKHALPLILLASHTTAQQRYSGSSALHCDGTANDLYACNGERLSCKAFLVFTARFPYDTVVTIAALTSSDRAEVAKTNNVTWIAAFREGQEVVVPVNCSCAGEYYQASAAFQVVPSSGTYYIIANATFQGLSTCNALMHANADRSATRLQPGDELRVPLRCACPTRKQAAAGTKFLMTYSLGFSDTLYLLSKRFNVSMTTISEANGLSGEPATTIYPFTTILIPFSTEPSRSPAMSRGHDSSISSPSPAPAVPRRKSTRFPLAAGIPAGVISLAIILLVFVFRSRRKRALLQQTRGGNSKPVTSHQDLVREIGRLDHSHGILRKQTVAVEKNSRDAQNKVRMLVYEHMENGSLQDWLRIRAAEDPNGWNHTIRIALDVANGLLYLHKFTNPAHVHNNISSSNILLDGNHLRVSTLVRLLRRPTCLLLE